MAEKYRETLLSDESAIDVFEDLLTDLRLYETIVSDEDRILHNFAIALLVKMGIYDGPNMRMVTRNLARIPLAVPSVQPESGPRDMRRY